MESKPPVWRRMWRPFENKWILLPSIILGIYGPSFVLRFFGAGRERTTTTELLWLWGLPTLAALIFLAVGVVKYRREPRHRNGSDTG